MREGTTTSKQRVASVKLQMTLTEKKRVLAVLKDHQKFYNEYKDEHYYQHNGRIGNDRVSYTTEIIINDLIHNKVNYWEANASSFIYEAYILRSNHIVRETSARFAETSTRVANEYTDRFYISYDDTPAPRYGETINLFDLIT